MLKKAYESIKNVKSNSPLVHNITNFVVMQTTANALLAAGASPLMAHAKEEMPDLMNIASALVLNIGTLSAPWIEAMEIAGTLAQKRNIPIVLDPVGAGASNYRTETSLKLLKYATILRGNASEIMVLAGASGVTTKGVDSTAGTNEAVEAAKSLAKANNIIVSVSGEKDYITNGAMGYWVTGGSDYMPKVTGMGCTATAFTAAHAAVTQNSLEAAVFAMAHMAVTGSKAALNAKGCGSFSVNFLDELSSLRFEDLEKFIKIENN